MGSLLLSMLFCISLVWATLGLLLGLTVDPKGFLVTWSNSLWQVRGQRHERAWDRRACVDMLHGPHFHVSVFCSVHTTMYHHPRQVMG